MNLQGLKEAIRLNCVGAPSIAFIMDGNRRWAMQCGLGVSYDHSAGYEKLVEVIQWVKEAGFEYATFFTLSSDNWNREEKEMKHILALLRKTLQDGFSKIKELDARLLIIGERERFPIDIQEGLLRLEEETKDNTGITVVFALSYSGRGEIVGAARRLISLGVRAEEVNEERFAGALWTGVLGIPDPDLIIRTSGEYRLSNFLLWQLSNAEFFFPKELWPDFAKKTLYRILVEFTKRKRRFGR